MYKHQQTRGSHGTLHRQRGEQKDRGPDVTADPSRPQTRRRPGPDVEIKEERLLELIIKVISITHMSDDPNDPKGFQPGALGYIPYGELCIKSNLDASKQKRGPTTPKAHQMGENTSGRSTRRRNKSRMNGQNTSRRRPAGDGAFFTARRVRFIEEFSFPADIDDIRDAVRFRLPTFLELNRPKVRFV